MADHKHEEAAEKANAKHDLEFAQKAADKKAAEEKEAAKLASERRATEQQELDKRQAAQAARQKAENEQRAADSAAIAARDPNTYEDPSYQKPGDVAKESKPAPISETTKAEMEAGKKAVAEAAKALGAAEKEAKKAE